MWKFLAFIQIKKNGLFWKLLNKLFDTTIIVGPLKFTARIILRHYTLPIEAPCDFCLDIDPLALPIAIKFGL